MSLPICKMFVLFEGKWPFFLATHLVDPGVVPPVGGVVVAEVAELPVAGLVVQVAQGVLVPLHRDVRGPHHLGHPPHCRLTPHLILTSASASDHLGAVLVTGGRGAAAPNTSTLK